MDIQVCTNVYVPLRKGPSHRSEMGSQILMGEKYEIIDSVGCYSKIKMVFDGYTGWIDNDHLSACSGSSDDGSSILAHDTVVTLSDGSSIMLAAGSEITDIGNDRKRFMVGNTSFETSEPIITAPLKGDVTLMALSYLNVPYLWGGRTSMGIDCSGLVQTVYKVHGISIPRDSFMQAEAGITINLLSDSQPGDLLFFDNDQGRITHVGMVYKNGEIIHCSGKVRIDMIDHQGVYRLDEKRYTHKLRLIKRFL